MSRGEFIALMAMLTSMVAISVDGMLPALPHMVRDLAPTDPNHVQYVISSFVGAMAVGTLFVGPLSDSFGRKTIIYSGAFLYVAGAILSAFAPNIELMIAARVLQGLGASGPRVVALAIIRDLFKGREMSKIVSYMMIIFSIVPALAPLLGELMMSFGSWRFIFISYVVFASVITTWLFFRLPETHPKESRQPFQVAALYAAASEAFRVPMFRWSVVGQCLSYCALFTSIILIQPIFDQSFGRAESFARWFAFLALLSASSGFLNARLVHYLGMRKLATVGFAVQCLGALLAYSYLKTMGLNGYGFYVFWLFQLVLFFATGMIMGNLNALAMEPLGHIAGMAASVMSATATFVGALASVAVGQTFDGTPYSFLISVVIFACAALLVMWRMMRLERVEKSDIAKS
jgi:DHA1 family bicyclomycin/chloramphenicol resistance-like MFS transporter